MTPPALDPPEDDGERLREALLDLERVKSREHEMLLVSERMVACLRAFTSFKTPDEIIPGLLMALRPMLEYHEAFLLIDGGDGVLTASYATVPRLAGTRWRADGQFARVTAEKPVVSFDVALVPEWREQPQGVRDGVRSTLILALRTGPEALDNERESAFLVCCHAEVGFFDQRHVRLAAQLSPVASQALGTLETTQELRRINQELKSANQELEAFSYSASHDLRAPLRTIDGFSRILLEDYGDKLDAVGKDSLQTLCAASQRMTRMIDDMLQLSLIARREMRPVTVDLSALARLVADELETTERERRVEVVIQAGLSALADAALMRSVLENLLGNAWKFTRREAHARIEFGRTTRGGTNTYFVRDNGVGFDPAYAYKLFGAFQRLHTTAEFPGTGIGLATVLRVIHRHGGRVWADSEIGQGAVFYFTLPNETKASWKSR